MIPELRTKIVLEGVREGKITQDEADAYLKARCGCSYEEASKVSSKPSSMPLVYTFLLIVAVIVGALYIPSMLPIGKVVLDIPHEILTNVSINQSITGLRVSGVLVGEGNGSIFLDTDSGTLLVAHIQSDTGEPRTDKASYAIDETVVIEYAPTDASYYFDDGETSVPIEQPFNATMNGTIVIVTNTSGTYRLPVIIGDRERRTIFSEICIDTCALTATNGTLRVATTNGASIILHEADASTDENEPPKLMIALPTLTLTEPRTLDLNMYFADVDELSYAAGSSTHVTTTINGSHITLTPDSEGEETITIYASDLQELVPASLHVIVPAATQVVINESNDTAILPEETPIGALDCSDPNPNLRPTECLLEDAVEYFPDQDIFWENLDRTRVAKVTIIGNLLIKGEVIEHSTEQPGPRDFRLGHVDRDDTTVDTIWIDTAGNLHLKGSLVEENVNLQPPPGSYSVITKRSIYLAYADMNTGTLYLRGNLIPYRRAIE